MKNLIKEVNEQFILMGLMYFLGFIFVVNKRRN